MRITEKQLRHHVELLQRQGYDVAIQWAYGRPRVHDKSCASDLSPRLRTGEMDIWLDGFDKGATAERERITDSDVALAHLLRGMCNGPNGSATKNNPYGNAAILTALHFLADKHRIKDYLSAAEIVLNRACGTTWIVSGEDRKQGAIGIFEPFEIELRAKTSKDAETKARAAREQAGRDHVSIRTMRMI